MIFDGVYFRRNLPKTKDGHIQQILMSLSQKNLIG